MPREVDPMLASQGFKDLLDEARSILEEALDATGRKIAQLTGAICPEGTVYGPGIWLVLRENGAAGGAGHVRRRRGRGLRTRLGLF